MTLDLPAITRWTAAQRAARRAYDLHMADQEAPEPEPDATPAEKRARRDAEIIRRHRDGETYAELGRVFRLDPSWVGAIVRAGKEET